MTILEFLLAYLFFGLGIPVLEKVCEFLATLIYLGTAKISLKLNKIQKEIEEIAGKDSCSSHVIGFQLPTEDYIEEEEYYEDCTEQRRKKSKRNKRSS